MIASVRRTKITLSLVVHLAVPCKDPWILHKRKHWSWLRMMMNMS